MKQIICYTSYQWPHSCTCLLQIDPYMLYLIFLFYFIFFGSRITADSDFSHKIKICLLLVRKAMTNLDSILKSRDIALLTNVHLVKAECWRIDAFELWCWRRLLRIPWTARRSNQSILKEISPEYSLEGVMLKLKLQYFGHLMRRTDSLENALI